MLPNVNQILNSLGEPAWVEEFARSPKANKIIAVGIGLTDSFSNQSKSSLQVAIAVRLQGVKNEVATSAAIGPRAQILIAGYGTGWLKVRRRRWLVPIATKAHIGYAVSSFEFCYTD